MNREDREKIARELVKVAKDLVAKAWYDYEPWEQEWLEKEASKTIRPMESAAKKAINVLSQEFERRLALDVSSHIAPNPYPGAKVRISPSKSSMSRPIISIESEWKRGDKWKGGDLPTFMGYKIHAYLPNNANPAKTWKVRKPTWQDIDEAMVWLRMKLGMDFYKLLGIDPDDTGDQKATVQDIKNVLSDTWFHVEDESRNSILFASREYGDVGNESSGHQDIQEAKRIRQVLLNKFGSNNVKVSIEPVDEWVNVNVVIK